jgi:N-acetylglucosamine-6-phosphate deacetylase
MNLAGTNVLASSGPGYSFWLEDATLTIHDGLVVGINQMSSRFETIDTRSLGITMLVPGFVDMHCHGGGGGSFTSGDVDQARRAASFHLQHGTTSLMASLVTAPHDDLLVACKQLAPLVHEGILAGIHLEGPYLSHLRCGAQDPRWLRHPDPREIDELFAAAGDTIRQVTIAPELPGAIDAIRQIAHNGAVAAIGHTNADAHHVEQAVAAGARIATHLCNAMPPLHHRDPSSTASMLTNPEIICELIADGHHLSESMFQILSRSAGPGRWALVTDAMSAAGQPDGEYTLGSQTVSLRNGQVRLVNHPNNALAGSVLTMDQALRNSVAWGVDPIQACESASLTPAQALGLGEKNGRLALGAPADIVGLSADYEVLAVWKQGIRVR